MRIKTSDIVSIISKTITCNAVVIDTYDYYGYNTVVQTKDGSTLTVRGSDCTVIGKKLGSFALTY